MRQGEVNLKKRERDAEVPKWSIRKWGETEGNGRKLAEHVSCLGLQFNTLSRA